MLPSHSPLASRSLPTVKPEGQFDGLHALTAFGHRSRSMLAFPGSSARYSRAMRALVFLPLLLSMGCAPAAPAALPAPPKPPIALREVKSAPKPTAADPRHAATDKVFERFDKPDSPGCALAVTQDGQVVYSRGYGMANLDHDVL